MHEFWFTTAQRKASHEEAAKKLEAIAKANKQLCELLFHSEKRKPATDGKHSLVTLELMERLRELTEQKQLPKSKRNCPECSKAMALFRLPGINLDGCRKCKSYWFDDGELQQFTRETDDVPATYLGLASRPTDRCCPRCRVAMQEVQFDRGSNLLVDACPKGHGVYLQSGELDRALRW